MTLHDTMLPTEPLQKALRLLQQNKLGPAIALVKKQLHQSPQDFNAQHLLGVLLLKQHRVKQAVYALNCAAALPAPAKQKAQALNNLSLGLQQQGQFNAARQALQQAIEICPTDPAFYCNLANLAESEADFPAMADNFRQALSLQPGMASAALGYAIALRKLEQPAAAQQELKNITEADRDYDWLCEWCLIGSQLQQQSLLFAELDQLKLDGDSWRDLADYIAEEGYAALATPFYSACLLRNPSDHTAQHMLAAIAGEDTVRAPASYVSTLYDRCADEFEKRLVQTLGYNAPTLATTLLRTFNILPAQQVLDLGCGTGLMGQALAEATTGQQLIGVDLSQSMLDLAANKQCYAQLIHSDVLNWQNSQQFSLICAMDLLIYLGELTTLLDKVTAWLTPGGHFVCTLELCSFDTPQLQPSGRFRHSIGYISKQASIRGLIMRHQETLTLRREGNSTVEGAILLLQKEACRDRTKTLPTD
ncbi:methyltransferase domain-containing protein [Pontibacter sp. JAM-7]|uniref:methyltransferase domain-containing protein n=1 Tax=Pontibacter sp. JAM-7 TaxID=3366581 RepID=UPI003AF74E4A